jgi:Ca2+/Na+ antiporter
MIFISYVSDRQELAEHTVPMFELWGIEVAVLGATVVTIAASSGDGARDVRSRPRDFTFTC